MHNLTLFSLYLYFKLFKLKENWIILVELKLILTKQKIITINKIYFFHIKNLKRFTFCVKLSDSIFFVLCLSPIVKII